MSDLKIEEAIEFYNENRKEGEPKMVKNDLGKVIFDNSSEDSRFVSMSRLITGKTKRIPTIFIHKICHATGVDANFLLGIEPTKEFLKWRKNLK